MDPADLTCPICGEVGPWVEDCGFCCTLACWRKKQDDEREALNRPPAQRDDLDWLYA